jgi:hypothetical protein
VLAFIAHETTLVRCERLLIEFRERVPTHREPIGKRPESVQKPPICDASDPAMETPGVLVTTNAKLGNESGPVDASVNEVHADDTVVRGCSDTNQASGDVR